MRVFLLSVQIRRKIFVSIELTQTIENNAKF